MRQQGFTLVELLLSVSIIVILVGLSLPVYFNFVARNDLNIATQNLTSSFRRAQTNARGVNGDASWGVAIVSESVVLFKGATYATRDSTYDEVSGLQGSITTSGITEVVFSKLFGAPNTTGTVTLSNTQTNETRTVTLNAKGTVSY